jgi:hypothetical protein
VNRSDLLIRCDAKDEHFVTFSDVDDGTWVVSIEDFYRCNSVWKRLKLALKILVFGEDVSTDIILSLNDATNMHSWLNSFLLDAHTACCFGKCID